MNAQTLTGFVYDKATKQPVPSVYVYLDGTQIVDVTTNAGHFTLTVKQMINTNLVVRHIAYQTFIIENPFVHLPDTIYLEEQPNTLGEVTVRADRFSRQQKMRAFREHFLGMTQAGNSCRILNEDDIQLTFNLSTNTLFASSDKPIEVANSYLGYRVLFSLNDFWVKYSGTTLNSTRAQSSYYNVNTSFTDLRPNDERTKRRRDDVYEESSRNFFKSLAYGSLLNVDTVRSPILIIKDGVPKDYFIVKDTLSIFKIYKDGSKIDPYLYFTVKDTLLQKMIHIPDSIIEKENPDNSLFRISILHREKAGEMDYRQRNLSGSSSANILLVNDNGMNNYSGIRFFTNTLFVDQYGNIDKVNKVFFSGFMGRRRAGDMLPMEYEP
jgi:hypothetical protein